MSLSKKPNKQTLETYLPDTTVSKLAEIFKVERKTMRKWLKSYNLQTSFQNKIDSLQSTVEVSCLSCSEKFHKKKFESTRTVNHFCSRSCAAQFNNKLFPKRSKNWGSYGDLIENIGKRKAGSYIRMFARDKCRNLKQECKICGYSTYVEICHIKPVSSFDPHCKEAEINSIDNLVILCPNHHKELDLGILIL